MKDRRGWLCLLGAAAAALVLVFAVAACGGEEKKSDSGQPAPAAGGTAVSDACKIITQEDASALFGKPAVRQEGQMMLDQMMVSECIWTWDTDTQNQLLQFSIWNGEQYFDTSLTGAQPLDLGDRGLIRINGSVAIQWVQNGKTIDLDYSTIDFSSGAREIPKASTKVEEVKRLAKKVEGEL